MKKNITALPLASAFGEAQQWDRRSNSGNVSDLPNDSKPYQGKTTVEQRIGQLTSREMEVLQFVATGKLNKQAASELCISIKTVEKHREHLSKKLGIRGIAGLTHFAIHAGIIECDPQLAAA